MTKNKSRGKDRACPLCGSFDLQLLLFRKTVSVFQNRVHSSFSKALQAPRGTLRLESCGHCSFVFNSAFEPQKVKYNRNYLNSQVYSGYFAGYLDGLTRHLLRDRKIKNSRILEIGCGQGDLLRRLVGQGNQAVGVDPAFSQGAHSRIRDMKILREAFRSRHLIPQPDVIICRHFIEHIPDPLAFLRKIVENISPRSTVRFFFETPSLEWILEKGAWWDFFYEHFGYFTVSALRVLFSSAGIRIKSIKRNFRKQYFLLEAEFSLQGSPVLKPVSSEARQLRRLIRLQEKNRQRISKKIQAFHAQGLAVWGAGAKGVTFAQLIDPQRKSIRCLVDLNPHKQGAYVPGSAHPIVHWKKIKEWRIRRVLLMNPNYYAEVKELLRKSRIQAEVLRVDEL